MMSSKGTKGDEPPGYEPPGDEEKEEHSSSDDGDHVDENGMLSGAPDAINAAEEFKQEMFEEEDEVHEALKASNSKYTYPEESLNYIVNKVKNQIRVMQQDLHSFTLDEREFCIDGDALLMSILSSDDIEHQCGGQTLHIVYLFEMYLLMFERKGFKFSIIFFEVWERFWENFSAEIALTRSVLRLHLMHNSSICVINNKAVWENDFKLYVSEQRPSFFLSSFVMPPFFSWFFCGEESMPSKQHKCSSECQKRTCRQDALKWAKFLLNAQTMLIHFLNLYVVEVESVIQIAASLNGNVHSPNANFYFLIAKVEDLIFSVMSTQQTCGKVYTDVVESGEVRRVVAVMSAVNLLKSKDSDASSKVPKNMVQLFLLYSAMMEAVPLKLRNPDVPAYIPPQLNSFIQVLQETMVIILNSLLKENGYQFKTVADLWHGRLFHFLYMYMVNFHDMNEEKIGEDICGIYKELIAAVNDAVTINAFPIEPISIKVHESHLSVDEIKDTPVLKYDSAVLLRNMIPASLELVELFCQGIMPTEELDQCTSKAKSTALKVFNTIKSGKFHEHRHWHNKKPLTDQYDRIKENKTEFPSKFHELRHAQYLSRWNLLYGKTVVGRDACPRTIVTKKPEKSTSVPKKINSIPQKEKEKGKKKSKKQLIIEENMKRKSKETEVKEKSTMDAFHRELKALKEKASYETVVTKCELYLKNVQNPNAVLKISVAKVSALWHMWKQECIDFKQTRKVSIAEKLFLTIKEILSTCNQMSNEDSEYIGMVLCKLGFAHIANCWDLPQSPIDVKYFVGENWAEFQLKHLGSLLDRNEGSVHDSRADGFMPDPWQVKLFDIIDNHQSVLVVAPTSSGKTFASYYCMEKVLQESDDGVIIYVSPTKALVNQVTATICAYFRKDLPPGKTLQGSFTRDFKFNVLKCQILTTVPEALEILLLSPRQQSWVNRIRYVIFDEIHCLAGQSGGVHWERLITLIPCPFLALSATIKEPESFCAWLQSVEDFKKCRAQVDGNTLRSMDSYKVHLVTHLDRHSHLTKNIMHGDGSFEHIHPYGLLDEVVLKENDGIPELLTMSPAETLELYQTMTRIFPLEEIKRLAPDVHLKSACPTGFVSMPAVKQYASEMRNFLLLHKSKFIDVIKALQPKYDNRETGNIFVVTKFCKLVAQLKTKGMLPALVFSYNRQIVEILPSIAVEYLEDQSSDEDSDDENLSRDERKKLYETQEVSTNLSEKRAKRRQTTRKFAKTLGLMNGGNILTSNGSLRGGGVFDETVVKHVEYGLLKTRHLSTDTFIWCLRKGLGKHHGGMGTKERSAVEILFRMKMLNLVCATGTLALGIHMPCKTVVVAGDSPFITPLEYHQMSGRAGRRGFDLEGNVIFMGLRKEKITSVVTGNVPRMVGNFPISISLIVQVLVLITDATDKAGKVSEEARKLAISRAYTLLENGLIYQAMPTLKNQIKHFFAFALQFLIYQGLLDDSGTPQMMCGIVTHLHYHTTTFAFLHLLRSGTLHELCKGAGNGEYELLIVLNYLFAPLHISSFAKKKKTYVNSKVILPPLPEMVTKELRVYNKRVMNVFGHYLKCLGDHMNKTSGPDTRLPLSNLAVQSETCGKLDIPHEGNQGLPAPHLLLHLQTSCRENQVCSTFAALAGKSDVDIFDSNGHIKNVRHDVLPDINILPIVSLNEEYNSYALDFYVHGIRKAIVRDNDLREGYDFVKLKDIVLAVRTLHLSLEELYGAEDALVKTFSVIDQNFRTNFSLAYGKMID